MDFFTNVYLRIVSGGVFMLPIFLISVLIFAIVLFRGIKLFIVLHELRKIFQEGTNAILSMGKWHKRAHDYIHSRSGIEKVDIELRDRLSHDVLQQLSSGKGILLCSALATLLGLLGTVNGMITSFDAINSVGVGNTKSMAAGISIALVTTQSGLLVGIVGVMLGNILDRLSSKLVLQVNQFYCYVEEKL